MQKLTHMAIKTLFDRMVQWNVKEMDDVQMKKILQLITYFDNLPFTLRDEVLTRLLDWNLWDGKIRDPQAWDVVPFLYENQRRLDMSFFSPNFDLEFLLTISGYKLKNLTVLCLPRRSPLTANACKQMCQCLPNLQKLHISGGVVEDVGALHIAQLPLVELVVYGTTELFVRNLCREDSTLRNTLRVFKFDGFDIPMDLSRFVLNTMPSIEDLNFLNLYSSKWLKALLPLDSPPQQYNLRQLYFTLSGDSIEDELDIAVLKCPKVCQIFIHSKVFTLKMLHSLTKFKKLTILYAQMDKSVTIDDTNPLSLRHLCLENLVEFCVVGSLDVWVSSGHFFQVLDMCPNLEKLTLGDCCGFSDKIAREFSELMAKKKLRSLRLYQWNLLEWSAIEDVLKIGSLFELKINLMNVTRELDFEAHVMETAERHGVTLQLEFIFVSSSGSDDDGGDGDVGD